MAAEPESQKLLFIRVASVKSFNSEGSAYFAGILSSRVEAVPFLTPTVYPSIVYDR